LSTDNLKRDDFFLGVRMDPVYRVLVDEEGEILRHAPRQRDHGHAAAAAAQQTQPGMTKSPIPGIHSGMFLTPVPILIYFVPVMIFMPMDKFGEIQISRHDDHTTIQKGSKENAVIIFMLKAHLHWRTSAGGTMDLRQRTIMTRRKYHWSADDPLDIGADVRQYK
jgi:hypothetical protein